MTGQMNNWESRQTPCAEDSKHRGEIPCPAPRRWSRTPHSWRGGCLLPKSTDGNQGQRGSSRGKLTSTPLARTSRLKSRRQDVALKRCHENHALPPWVSLLQTHNPSWTRRKTPDRSQLRGAQPYLTSVPPQTVQVIKTKRSLGDCPRQEEPEETWGLKHEALVRVLEQKKTRDKNKEVWGSWTWLITT